MRKPLEHHQVFQRRRARLAEQIPGSALIVYSYPEEEGGGGRGGWGSAYETPSSSNFVYLTGFEEPESIFVFRPGQKPESTLFVRPKDPLQETWEGFRFGPEEAGRVYHMDQTYPLGDFSKVIGELLKPVDRLYYKMFENHQMDLQIQRALLQDQKSNGRTGWPLLPILDAYEVMSPLRAIKTQEEIVHLRTACEISAQAHVELMKYARPGMNERELHGYFIYQIMKEGAQKESYTGIFASGANACTLHYTFNDNPLREKDMILVDAGAQYNYFCGDITRCFPVGKKFTSEQKIVYQHVLDVQKKVIEFVKPGVNFDDLQKLTKALLLEAMLDLGLFSGRKEDLLKTDEGKKYFPHGVSHYLGMDVHDVGFYKDRNNQWIPLQEGMVFTVEPGLYIPLQDSVASKGFRGIGVRIEDDLVMTSQGCEVLTKGVPKEIEEVESLRGGSGA